MIQPTQDGILVEQLPDEIETTLPSGLVIHNDPAGQGFPYIGLALAIGPQVLGVKVGEKVMWPRGGSGTEVFENGKALKILSEDSILATVE